MQRRNPHECAVAKSVSVDAVAADAVATRTNALWQSPKTLLTNICLESQPARMRCGKESAVEYKKQSAMSQPARMRCGKVAIDKLGFAVERRNPHECAVAKPTEQKSNTNLRVATRTNALWQN